MDTPVRRDNVFVVGCQRSGTSVVWASLIAHPELRPLRGYDPETGYDPKELYYFRNIFTARKRFSSPMYGWDVDRQYLRELVDTTVAFCCRHHGSASGRFVNAHPADALNLPEMVEWMPAARFVYVLRHPEEVVWSALHAPWAGSDGSLDDRIRRNARHWSDYAQIAFDVLAGRFGDAVALVRHEDLLAAPDRVAADLAAHVGVEPHAAMADQLRAPTFNSSFSNDVDPASLNRQTRRRIARESRFRRIVVDSVGHEMEALGYEDLGNPPRLALPLRLLQRRG